MPLSDFNLITDRTQADVERYAELQAKGWQGMSDDEKAEWKTFLKGAYNYTDLNRVESAVEYVANRLTQAGYVTSLVVKKDWAKDDKPTLADMKRYMQNISDIREALTTLVDTPEAPTADKKLTYEMANAMEQILIDINSLVTLMLCAYFYSNDIYCGEVTE